MIVIVVTLFVFIVTATFLVDAGIRSQSFVRVSQVAVGSVFLAADAYQRGEWQLNRVSSADVCGRQFAHRV